MISIQHFMVNRPAVKLQSKNVSNGSANVVTLPVDNNSEKMLENYLTLVGKQNKSLVSFGYANAKEKIAKTDYPSLGVQSVNLPNTNVWVDAFRPTLSDYTKWKIRTEATNRIYGKKPWKKLDNIEAWMVSAETNQFMIVGGLGKVAADLPASFNRKFAGDSKNNMTVFTPMYTYKDEYKLFNKDGKYYYKYGTKLNQKTKKIEPKVIEVKPVGKINVPIYNPNTNRKMQDTEVQLFKAYVDYTINPKTGKPNHDGTNYIFLSTPDTKKDDKGYLINNATIFDIESADPNAATNKTPYCYNKYGIGETQRMAFFSKSIYTAMKEIKEGNLTGLKAPNTLILNDWHAGPVAAMVRYTSNAEADCGKISSSTGKYFDDMQIIDILHNCEHQGFSSNDNEKRKNIFATLFGEHSADILSNSMNWKSDSPEYDPKEIDKNALMKGDNFSCGIAGLTLADRVVPVSNNYSEELLHSDIKANNLKDLFNARAFSPDKRTLTPITNGYTKSLIAPNASHMQKAVFEQLEKDLALEKGPKIKLDDIEFRPFDDGNLQNKLHNKNEFMKVLKRIQKRELDFLGKKSDDKFKSRRYFMYDPKNTVIPDKEDYSDTPVIVFAGRFDSQKGLNTILKDSLWSFAKDNVDTSVDKLPIFVIGGTITQGHVYDEFKKFKDELATVENGKYKHIAERIVLFKGYVNTNLLATAGDMFLVPSVFEPCGLTQMEAMAKGAVPIATSTGGLVDTIIDEVDGIRTKAFYEQIGWETKDLLYGEGFSNNGEAYCEAIERALDLFHNNKPKFEQIQKTAIAKDFSWDAKNGPLDKFIELIKTGKISE